MSERKNQERKPKILTFITRMEKGGVPYEVIQLATHPELSRKYESVIATGFCKNEVEIPNSIKVRRIKNFVREINPIKDILALFECIKIIKEEKPDIIHTRTSKAGFIGRLAAFLTRSENVIYSPHGHIFYGYFSPTKTFVFALLEYIASFFTDVITVRTEDEKNAFEDIGCRTNFFKIPKAPLKKEKGYDEKLNELISKLKAKKEEGKKIIGTISRFEPVKGIEYLAKAFLYLQRKRQDIFLLLVGDGSEKEKIKNLLKDTKEFLMPGWIESKSKIYPLFDVFVVPSLNEAWGITIIEAGEFGIPIVASSVGGIPYFTGGYVKLVPPKNHLKIAEAIEEIIENPSLAKILSQKSRELHEKYTEELMIQKYIELYDGILSGKFKRNRKSQKDV